MATKKKESKAAPWIALASTFVIIYLGVSCGYTIAGGNRGSESVDTKQKEELEQYRWECRACELAEQAMRELLKNPDGAKFQKIRAISFVKDVWTVRGTYDATNGFGAVIRSTFQIVFKIDRSGESPVWNITNIEIDGITRYSK